MAFQLNLNNLGKLWEDICNLVIRPHRCNYEPSVALGPKLFTLGNRIFERKDFAVTNSRNLKIQCSHYQPIESQRPAKQLPCVIYCHGNCGSRCDALDAVQILLPYNITVLAFDFSGSGLSEGSYVSLGFYEKQDIASLVEHLRQTKTVSRIGLWGRSMGAATSIMFSKLDPGIAGIVVDSPFTSLEDVMTELVLSHQSWVPKQVIKLGINMMRKSIQTRAGFDIRQNSPLEYAKKCYVPALFAHAEGDDFIKIHHSEKLFESYGGDKNIIRFEGDHNSERPEYFYDAVCIFFYNTLVSNDPNLDETPVPSGSIAAKSNVGKPTSKGKKIAEQDDEDEEDDYIVDDDEDKFSKPISSTGGSDVGTLPSTPKSQQVYLPSSLIEEAPSSSDIEEQQLLQAYIESIKSELALCKEEKERENLNARLEELLAQQQQQK